MDKIALVGAGLIGQAWAIVFARSGYQVALFDPEPGVLDPAQRAIAHRLRDLEAFELIDDPDAIAARIRPIKSIAEALDGAIHVQENAPEHVEVKRQVHAELDRLAAPDAVLASSTSGIPASAFTEDLAGRHRCLVAHPINPPYLVPLVELCPAPWTDPLVVDRTYALMRAAGQSPIRVRRELKGFVVNPMQGALIGAALKLVEDGYASAEDVDIAIRDGIGLRWSFMGPFETIDLNAPGGIADYLERYGPLYAAIERDQARATGWDDAALTLRIEADRRRFLPRDRLEARSAWRDRRLMALMAHRRKVGKDIGE
ncbi:MAG: 3-hydroxyacyl-CoA dehydrogenase [Geminicoccaceae bacterium]